MLDFNDIPPIVGGPADLNAQRDELKRELLARLRYRFYELLRQQAELRAAQEDQTLI